MALLYAHSPDPATSRHGRSRLARRITWRASKQSWLTVQLLVDRASVDDAYRAYAYFRWVDDMLDEGGLSDNARRAFVMRQQDLVRRLYAGEPVSRLNAYERLLVDLVAGDSSPRSGLRAYIDHMMHVMVFDAERRGRTITDAELHTYTIWLATAVTEALHHFIGNRCGAPVDEFRYLAAAGAHVAHMLRDTHDDLREGYVNIPREVLAINRLAPDDMHAYAYRTWVMERVDLARDYFRAGRAYLEQVESFRCRLAGYAYIARFEVVLDAIERDGYCLRADYPERKSLPSVVRQTWTTLLRALRPPRKAAAPVALPATES